MRSSYIIKLASVLGLVFLLLFLLRGAWELNRELRLEVQSVKTQLESTRKDFQFQYQANSELLELHTQTANRLKELESRFQREGRRSFEDLVSARPGLVEPLIQRGSDRALECLQLATKGVDCED